MVVGGGARYGSAPGCPQSRAGSPDERARPGRGELALALYRGDAVGLGIRLAARTDEDVAPRRGSRVGGHWQLLRADAGRDRRWAATPRRSRSVTSRSSFPRRRFVTSAEVSADANRSCELTWCAVLPWLRHGVCDRGGRGEMHARG